MDQLKKWQTYLVSVFKTVQPMQHQYSNFPLRYPLDKDDYCDAWIVTKNDGVEYAKEGTVTTRPIILRYNDDYKAYWFINDAWYQIGDTNMVVPLGRKIRHLVRYEWRNTDAFYTLLKVYRRLVTVAPIETLVEMHKELNLFAYHVRNGSRELGPTQWRWIKLESEYLKAIRDVNGRLVDVGVKINHFTVSWTDLEVTNSTG